MIHEKISPQACLEIKDMNKDQDIIVIYHNADLDGHCGGAIVRHALENMVRAADSLPRRIWMRGMNYGDPFTMKEIPLGATVIMVDFALQPITRMLGLNSYANLIWLDHHETSLAESHRADLAPLSLQELEKIVGRRTKHRSGCMLAWDWYHPHTKMPDFITALGKYDLWDHSCGWEEYLEPFQYGFRSLGNTDPGSNYALWERLFDMNSSETNLFMLDMIRRGVSVRDYVTKSNTDLVKAGAFNAVWETYNCLVCNGGDANLLPTSELYDPQQHQIAITYQNIRGMWKVNLRTGSTRIDLSEIAKKYGGGGHKSAAGFSIKELPIEFTNPEAWQKRIRDAEMP